MRRRLTFAILGTVAATLLVAGLGTLVLARFGARQQTEGQLRIQARDVAASIADVENTQTLTLVNRLRRALNLQGIEVMRFGPGGRTVDAFPSGVTAGDLDVARLRNGETITGNHGSLVYAAAPAAVTRSVLPVVVLTRQADLLLRPAIGWFLAAAALTLALGALVAWGLSRRLARPLQHAEDATRRIASGDLSTRVPDPGGGDELAALARSINTMAEGLERSRGVEQQFLMSISHDLRTPLTSIRGYAEAIADGTMSDSATGGSVILAEARRLERLVRDLLDLATLETRQFRLDRQPVDLTDIAAGMADGFRPEADDAGIAFEVMTDGPAVVDADPDRLAQVGANLVENALKFARSRVRLAVSSADGWARLDVIDDGPGIADVDLPHVFERLYVSRHQPQRTEAGSGLGLAIVRELVVALGGTVSAGASPSGGTRLTVALPLVSSAEAALS